MALNDIGVEVPADTDTFAPALDMRELGGSLVGRVVVPVANAVERDALAAVLSPTPTKPLYVHRADASVAGRLEWTEDGATWRVAGVDTGVVTNVSTWVTMSRTPSWYLSGGVVSLFGRITRSDRDWQNADGVGIGGFPPPMQTTTGFVRIGARAVTANLDPAGSLTLQYIISGSGGLRDIDLDGFSFPVAL